MKTSPSIMRQRDDKTARRADSSAADFLPKRITLRNLREAAEVCRGCELFRRATQVVFGAGPASASLMIVGEVPGDREDELGKSCIRTGRRE